MSFPQIVLVGIFASLATIGILQLLDDGKEQNAPSYAALAATTSPPAGLILPDAKGKVKLGQELFTANCAACHGQYATGTNQGPPLIHKIYEPSHHADIAFYMAVERGVRAHHWSFGDMPPIDGVTKEQVALIIKWVRALQRKNGIH